MIGLFLSEAILFAAAAVAGFALGWRGRAFIAAQRMRTAERDVETLRAAIGDAQVRRARGP